MKGFTLIELMIVVLIVMIGAAWAIPQYLDYTQIARRSDAMRSLNEMLSQQELFYSNNGGTYTDDVGNLGYNPYEGDTSETLSENQHYIISMSACPGSPGIADCVNMVATANPLGSQVDDLFCTSLSINSRGQASDTHHVSAIPPLNYSCWE